MTVTIGRRELLVALGGVTAAWPRAARAQQPERMRRIGVLLASTADDPEYKPRMRAFEQALALLGWNDGRNARIDIRWAGTNPANVEVEIRQAEAAANSLGLQTIHILQASTEPDLDAVFSTLIQQRAGGLVITADTLFSGKSAQLAALASRHSMPTISPYREFVTAGGLMSYGGSVNELYRLVGVYTGRVLNGENPADLPVQQVTKVELVINLKTAKSLGLDVPPSLLARADEVIE